MSGNYLGALRIFKWVFIHFLSIIDFTKGKGNASAESVCLWTVNLMKYRIYEAKNGSRININISIYKYISLRDTALVTVFLFFF